VGSTSSSSALEIAASGPPGKRPGQTLPPARELVAGPWHPRRRCDTLTHSHRWLVTVVGWSQLSPCDYT
jgi:hypothetical protein